MNTFYDFTDLSKAFFVRRIKGLISRFQDKYNPDIEPLLLAATILYMNRDC